MNEPMLTIVVPCYNEEEVLPETIRQLRNLREELIAERLVSPESTLLFVDDGSGDATWDIIYKASLRYPEVKGVKLARNAGHQNALLAGLFAAKTRSDCIVSIDADLQDDISVIRDFVQKFHEGYEIVYGVRNKRDTDTFFKRHTAQWFYKLMRAMGVDLVYNHADYRLMSRRAVEELERFEEVNLFLRGIVPLLGFRSTTIYYDRKERFAGKTKYPLKKMIAFALDGITSFSITPIRIISLIGFVSFFVSLLFGVYFLLLKFTGHTQTGWTSLITSIWFLGGLQLIAFGLIGEYIGKIYKETKRRPRYIVDLDLFNLPMPQPWHQSPSLSEGLTMPEISKHRS
ncbi:glycosyltransferase family 2 protein [Parageobacillus toebii NBRC 107807]|uniref:Glycosyltransferase involved in cell wall biosynthesis n=1 Tax=Parageobacillus toebii NBRC 107807 TaxID=1223503 RepID=A0A6G9J6F9_9BACL|nr:glycosyltransferase family 2 protein [Parageobacillus toebii]MBB3869459.1 glycosyltransferase involved in cell wall biosynthesis [Parageobacillus toebii NBRC 107807]QIQ33752.1 glycosyltransferase family 2 protein [Parageobacillus toebii NBRC 107807]WMT18740.1 glycosyltransferase family 2 protein [Parageobacillus toebii]